MINLLVLLFYLFHHGRTQHSFLPAAIPLVVRSPYLNCWGYFLDGADSIGIPQPLLSRDTHSGWDPSLDVFNLVVLVRVDNITYLFLGSAPDVNTTVKLTNTLISPTQTQLSAEAGPMRTNLTFLNPIEPQNWVKQSIPFSYMSLTAESLDGAAHDMQVYSDLSVDWLSGNQMVIIKPPIATANFLYHTIYPQSEWELYYATKLDHLSNITTKIAGDSVSRDLFQRNGVLDDQMVDNRNPVTPNSTVFAISHHLGTIQAWQDPVIWVIGYNADPVIYYTDLSGTPPQPRRLFYKSQYSDFTDAWSLINDFISDFANASSRAQELDLKILQYTAPISEQLGDLVSLATAQSDVMALMRNFGGLKTYRVNAVETLYSAFPALMCIDPQLGGLLLEPLFRSQASKNYTNPYAAADLGMDYPDVTLTNSAHNQGVERLYLSSRSCVSLTNSSFYKDSGNMLIMTYAHARASGDSNLINRYYDLLTSWADYLSNTTLLVHDQFSADGLSADNQTNLAIKGIIAIGAMSKMSSLIKRDADVDKYSSTAAGLYAQWKSLALSGDDHLFATYEQVGSWTLGYNLFADVWLNTSIVESSVFDGQSNFINNLTLASDYGLGMPVDNLGNDTNVPVSSWSLFAAAMIPDQDLRTKLVFSVRTRELMPYGSINPGPSILIPGPSPAQGAMYAPLALKVPVLLQPANPNPNPNPTTTGTSSNPHTGVPVVTRSVIGGVAALLAIGTIALVVWHRRRRSHRRTSVGPSFLSEAVSQGAQVTVTPFDPTGPTLTEVTPLVPIPRTNSQQLLDYRPSSPDDSLPPLRRASVIPVPVGLSSKELAQLRSLANAGSRPQLTEGPPHPPLIATTDGDGPDGLRGPAGATTSSSEAQRLRLENNFLRHEIEQLHAERSELPPSYASGVA
ncbi:hypothetical protein EDB87DRAFT_713658 [Lactarius vividus]|nr:hypothetical protein EDB87DRAFT_713658 [Lactarius vividus]